MKCSMQSQRREFRFFHADRSCALSPGQKIELDANGLSAVGRQYSTAIQTKSWEALTAAERREFLAERVKRDPKFANAYVSRMQAFFGANSILEATAFANAIDPRPPGRIPIFEVFARSFWTMDSAWLDYDPPQETNFVQYWYGSISNSAPSSGDRRPPALEVLMALPVRIGEIVGWAEPIPSTSQRPLES